MTTSFYDFEILRPTAVLPCCAVANHLTAAAS